MTTPTPIEQPDEELDKILELLVVATANQYGGYEGRDEETDQDIETAKKAIKAL